MLYTVKDRLVVGTLFPAKANCVKQLLARHISEKLAFTQEQLAGINYRLEGDQWLWDRQKATVLEVDVEPLLEPEEYAFLKAQAFRLDREGGVTQDNLDLVLKLKGVWEDEKKEEAKPPEEKKDGKG